jgi:serine protease AprX
MRGHTLRRPFGLQLQLVFIYGMLFVTLTAFMPLAQATHITPHAQPQLLALAAQHPSGRVSVIVQKLAKDNSVEQLVTQLRGVVTKDLYIINAFAAEVPAQAVAQLARANGVRWISLDAPVVKTACAACIDSSRLASSYPQTVGASRLWNEAPGYLQGQGIGVAVIDSGISATDDIKTRVIASAKFSSNTHSASDANGHGSHVAGIIGGDGTKSGAYIGIAPKVNLINVKVSDNSGASTSSDVVNGLQWILNNKDVYNIRVVNMSLNSAVQQSYNIDPLDAAVEVLWFNKIVVVVAAGNNAMNALNAPANDPFVITVGATDDMGTADRTDDHVAAFSGYGTTVDGLAKPDLVAPGTNIISLLPSPNAVLAIAHPDHIVVINNQSYFRMSGTSIATPVVAGAVALLLQNEPNLTPDQVKYRLLATAYPLNGSGAGAGELDIYTAVHATTTASANTGVVASHLLWTGSNPVNWNSVNWNSVNWNSVNWES